MLTQVFMYEGAQVRTVIINGQPWMVAKDLCDILEISNPTQAIARLEDDERSMFNIGRQGEVHIVNEYGMYTLILGSRKPEAKAFKRWITHEVLPQIRITGSYQQNPQLPQNYKEALIALVGQVEKTEQLEAQIEADKPLKLFAESLQISNDSILVGELAKLLKQNGIDIGQNRLFITLRKEGYLMSHGEQYNMPTQRSMDLKLMEVKTGSRNGSDGTIRITRTPKITGKGQVYFINKFKGQKIAN